MEPDEVPEMRDDSEGSEAAETSDDDDLFNLEERDLESCPLDYLASSDVRWLLRTLVFSSFGRWSGASVLSWACPGASSYPSSHSVVRAMGFAGLGCRSRAALVSNFLEF